VINVGIARDSRALAALLDPFDLGNGPFIIVPNWHCARKGYGTDAQTLRTLLEVLPGSKTIVESYDAARTADPGRFEGLDLAAARQHQGYLREQDQVFLRQTGLGEVLREHDAEYLSVTEEVWEGRTADAREVQAAVEQRYGPVVHQELYGMVPSSLWDQRGCTLVNCAKMKACGIAGGVFFSLSMKNLFGLIPVPNRYGYHGASEKGLSRSIVDCNQVYASLFPTVSLCEAMHSSLISATTRFDDEASLVADLGLVAVSDRAVELDAFLVSAMGVHPEERNFLRMGAEVFGQWHENDFPPLPPEAAHRLADAMRGGVAMSIDPADNI